MHQLLTKLSRLRDNSACKIRSPEDHVKYQHLTQSVHWQHFWQTTILLNLLGDT